MFFLFHPKLLKVFKTNFFTFLKGDLSVRHSHTFKTKKPQQTSQQVNTEIQINKILLQEQSSTK